MRKNVNILFVFTVFLMGYNALAIHLTVKNTTSSLLTITIGVPGAWPNVPNIPLQHMVSQGSSAEILVPDDFNKVTVSTMTMGTAEIAPPLNSPRSSSGTATITVTKPSGKQSKIVLEADFSHMLKP